jgi:uncharacterized protein (TIGR03435 family)
MLTPRMTQPGEPQDYTGFKRLPMRRTGLGLLTLVLLSSQPSVSAQQSFEVASIKRSKTDRPSDYIQLPPGRLSARNVRPRALILFAFGLHGGFDVAGEPPWIATERFDIEARSENAATPGQVRVMLQSLLAERFSLTFHREKRDIDGFALRQQRIGVLGPNLMPSEVDCSRNRSMPRCRGGSIGPDGSGARLRLYGTPLHAILREIVRDVQAPVVDNTGLTGPFDIELRWSPEFAPSGDLPGMPTALREQLGLTLERQRVPVDVFVIDRIERPSPD